MLGINIGQFKYILADRSKYAINKAQNDGKQRTETTHLKKNAENE